MSIPRLRAPSPAPPARPAATAPVLTFLGLALLVGPGAAAQSACENAAHARVTDLSSVGADALRLAELRGRTGGPALRQLRRRSLESDVAVCGLTLPGLTPAPNAPADGLRWRLTTPILRGTLNSAYPVDRANGALWGGKGLSGGASLGAALRWKVVTLQVAPVVGYALNDDFALRDSTFADRSRFAHPWQRQMDWPQRFGEESHETLDAGESFLRVDWGPVAAGVSNEVLTWGPARRYPLLLGDAAPGFAHGFVGLNAPRDIRIGLVDVQILAGRLRESDYFNESTEDDDRELSGLFGSFRPRGFEELEVGLGAILTNTAEDGQTVLDAIANPLGFNPEGNGIFALFFRWTLPESGFELYGEWARDDATQDIEDLLGDIDDASAWMAGFQKTTETANGIFRLGFEMTDLKAPENRAVARGSAGFNFYSHGQIQQGHTNRGQLLGAWVGPGSDAQFLQVDLFRERTRYGVFFERVRRDDDTYARRIAPDYSFRGHDTEFTGGARVTLQSGPWLVDVTGSLSHRKNRSFIGLDDGTNVDFLREQNAHLEVVLSWLPDSLAGWRLPGGASGS